jgi:hypothetical protein
MTDNLVKRLREYPLRECREAADRIEKLEAALRRYRNETPLGHQPHMIAHEVDMLLEGKDG